MMYANIKKLKKVSVQNGSQICVLLTHMFHSKKQNWF